MLERLVSSVTHRKGAPRDEACRAAVEVLAAAVELRDEYTGGHIARVSAYSVALAHRMDPALTSRQHVYGYMLHDIGKLAISDAILLKRGPLTESETELMRTHTTIGASYIETIPFLRPVLPVVRNHHERWDGAGYPDGLRGLQIPLVARIFAVADALDAITTDRPYRAARAIGEAVDEITRCAGSQFDPSVVAVLLQTLKDDPAFAELRSGIVPGRRADAALQQTRTLQRVNSI